MSELRRHAIAGVLRTAGSCQNDPFAAGEALLDPRAEFFHDERGFRPRRRLLADFADGVAITVYRIVFGIAENRRKISSGAGQRTEPFGNRVVRQQTGVLFRYHRKNKIYYSTVLLLCLSISCVS